MAKNLCSFCCCSSCCGLLSPSQQQQQQPISSPQQSPQQQQQQPISSPPHQQSIAAHSSTSSPSQPSQQEPTATMTDFKNFLQKFNDINQIDTLILFLEELVEIASGNKNGGGSNPHIRDGQTILDMLDKRFGKRPAAKNSGNSTIEEIKKVCIEGLKSSEKIPKVGMALSILGSVLERFIKMSENKSECLDVLRRMLNLGKQIVQLNEQIPKEEEKLNEGVQYIIEGTFMCISQLAKANFFGFLTATVNADSLKAFQQKIDRLYPDIQLSTTIHIVERVTEIGNRVPKIASESQKIYAYQPTVGIEGAQECVIKLLDLNAQDAKSIVVVVYGFGGIGKTTLADAVYAQLNLQSYTKCRIHMDQDCTSNDLKTLQEQILHDLFSEKLKLRNCDEGQGRLSSFFKESHYKPLFLYIDNGLKSRDLEKLLPKALDSCLPPKSRILITTRNLHETNLFVGRNIERQQYDVKILPQTEARKLLLEKVSNYKDENNIENLLKLCGGVPLLLEIAGSQLAINKGNAKKIVLEMLKEGENVQERDISDRMVGFVYDRLLPPVQEAFLDIASFFYKYWNSEKVGSIVGEEEFRALEAASFVKTDEKGRVIVHDIVRARGKKLSKEEGNRVTERETLLECLKNDEKLKKLKGIYFEEESEQPPIEINCHHLNCMSNSLEVLRYSGSEITFRENCQKPFKQLRCLSIDGDVPDLPMELEKLEHLVYYKGPVTQGMNFYEFPPSLRYCAFNRYYSPQNRVAYSKIPPKVTPASSLVELEFYDCKNMQRLPDGLEKLTKLERLTVWRCGELRELPSKLGDLSNLKVLRLNTPQLKELPSNFGQLTNLQEFDMVCSGMAELHSDFGQLQNLRKLELTRCYDLRELPSNFGQLTNLQELSLSHNSGLAELPSYIGQLQNLRKLDLCCCKEKELPFNFGQLTNLEELDLSWCEELAELPSDIGQLQNLRKLNLRDCYKLEEWPLSFADLINMKEIDLTRCSSKLKHSLPKNMKGNNCTILEKAPLLKKK